jgi:hypothetical protein
MQRREGLMMNVMDLVDRYVAVWNEPNADERRKRIRSLWAPDGTTCYGLLDAHGYEAIEARVTGSWDKWLRGGTYTFRPKNAVCHHGVIKFDWVMCTVPGGDVEAGGLSFLILNPDRRIKHDYQFNPSVNDAGEAVERYLAVVNEASAERRRRLVAELWAVGGAHVTEASASTGHGEIAAALAEAQAVYGSRRLSASPANRSQTHHQVAWFQWQLKAKNNDQVVAATSHLLILDEMGRIRFDYQFDEPA